MAFSQSPLNMSVGTLRFSPATVRCEALTRVTFVSDFIAFLYRWFDIAFPEIAVDTAHFTCAAFRGFERDTGDFEPPPTQDI